MLGFLPSFIKAPLGFLLFFINLFFWYIFFFPISIIKWVVPILSVKKFCTKVLIWIAAFWIDGNSLTIALTQKINWHIEGDDFLPVKGWNIVLCNHRSWVDIVVLQKLLNRRAPMLKFFCKEELRKIPILGFIWWALDFPFVKRYTREYLRKHPEAKDSDVQLIKDACEKFKLAPVSVMSFVEGTRFTLDKQKRQNSPYKNLLIPKVQGVSAVLDAMNEQMEGLIDVTIMYSAEKVVFTDLFLGNVKHIVVKLKFHPIPKELLGKDFQKDGVYRKQLTQWVETLWKEKDITIDSILEKYPVTA
ncbi:MAG: 1-acyl-sn-glycerol-3-phosphate acyltransferase [Leptospiraceae bacterium]|nr:1-acyl-sn-glycerol-3-phosphate acyltransferase [Leptospiraceae bacterium]MCP5497409.1 1-acyl-sn-glycerol-3-phosphate acyltransferase [Leptospiraceae bacterium]